MNCPLVWEVISTKLSVSLMIVWLSDAVFPATSVITAVMVIGPSDNVPISTGVLHSDSEENEIFTVMSGVCGLMSEMVSVMVPLGSPLPFTSMVLGCPKLTKVPFSGVRMDTAEIGRAHV